MTEITREAAAKVLKIVDAGLIHGGGKKAIAGQVCVEQAVCMGLGLPFSDNPSCVAPVLRSLKIKLNDGPWSSNQARARGLRRLALAQIGSRDRLNETEFVRRVVDIALRISCPQALRAAASARKDKDHIAALIAAAARCETEGTFEAALEARAAAIAARAAALAAALAAPAAAHAAFSASSAAADAAGADAADARDKSLAVYAESVVQLLIEMKAPGVQWLDLAPYEAMS
jgi:hypothetical protein